LEKENKSDIPEMTRKAGVSFQSVHVGAPMDLVGCLPSPRRWVTARSSIGSTESSVFVPS
jgi:hypothetical protein